MNKKETHNILILSVGRRVELVQLFKKAAKELEIESLVCAADCSHTAPALYYADKKYIVSKINSGKYIEDIIAICQKSNIKLVIPTIDTELSILAENKKEIESKTNAIVHISDSEVIEICNDKVKTNVYLEKHGFYVPKIYDKEDLKNNNIIFPLFIKPKHGSASKGAHPVYTKEELDAWLFLTDEPIVQDFLEGDEYTVDCFLDFNSNIISIVPRLRLETRDGEISKGIITKDTLIISEIKKLLNILKPIGQITIQVMKITKGIGFIEINPRFGGGAPMSIMAGANSCINLFKILIGDTKAYKSDYDQKMFLRFDQTIMLDSDSND